MQPLRKCKAHGFPWDSTNYAKWPQMGPAPAVLGFGGHELLCITRAAFWHELLCMEDGLTHLGGL